MTMGPIRAIFNIVSESVARLSELSGNEGDEGVEEDL